MLGPEGSRVEGGGRAPPTEQTSAQSLDEPEDFLTAVKQRGKVIPAEVTL